jgi:hypothetical protein
VSDLLSLLTSLSGIAFSILLVDMMCQASLHKPEMRYSSCMKAEIDLEENKDFSYHVTQVPTPPLVTPLSSSSTLSLSRPTRMPPLSSYSGASYSRSAGPGRDVEILRSDDVAVSGWYAWSSVSPSSRPLASGDSRPTGSTTRHVLPSSGPVPSHDSGQMSQRSS